MYSQEMQKKAIITPRLIALVGVVLMILSMIIPYASATEKYLNRLEWFEDELEDATGMDADDLENMSMLEFLSFFKYVSRDDPSMKGFDIFVLVIVAIIGVFTLFTLLFAVLKKTAGIIVFDILAFLAFCSENWVYTTMEIVPASYTWSVGYYLFFVGVIMAFVGAVLIAVEKSKQKKQAQALAVQQYYQNYPNYSQQYVNPQPSDTQQNQPNTNGVWQQ